jgi:hypothetical protein
VLFVTLVKLRKKLSKTDVDRIKAGLKMSEKIGAKTWDVFYAWQI